VTGAQSQNPDHHDVRWYLVLFPACSSSIGTRRDNSLTDWLIILGERCLSEAVSSYRSDFIPTLNDIPSHKPAEEVP
jgi:hypothetical protein